MGWRVYTNTGALKTSSTGGGGSGAPTDATYIVQTAHGDLTDEQALSSLESGFMLVENTTGVVSSVKSVFDATAAPDANDDSGDGFSVGSRWLDVTADKEYVCLDATPTAAVWVETTATGSGGGTMDDFSVAADTGTPAVIGDADTLTIAGGTGLDSAISGSTVTLNIDSTVATLTGAQTLTNKTLTTPTIGDLTNATHNHTNAAGGGQITDAALSSAVGISKGGTGQTTQTAAMDALSPTTTKGDLLIDDGTNVIRLAAGTNGHVLTADSAQTAGVKWAAVTGGGSTPYAILQHQETTNTAGGALAATTWTTRPMNAEVVDADSIVSISSNQFTPISGTYRMTMNAELGNGTGLIVRHRLRNITAGSTPTGGISTNSRLNSSGTKAILECIFTANGTDAYAIQYYSSGSQATNGLGVAINEAGQVEIYATVFLEKIA